MSGTAIILSMPKQPAAPVVPLLSKEEKQFLALVIQMMLQNQNIYDEKSCRIYQDKRR